MSFIAVVSYYNSTNKKQEWNNINYAPAIHRRTGASTWGIYFVGVSDRVWATRICFLPDQNKLFLAFFKFPWCHPYQLCHFYKVVNGTIDRLIEFTIWFLVYYTAGYRIIFDNIHIIFTKVKNHWESYQPQYLKSFDFDEFFEPVHNVEIAILVIISYVSTFKETIIGDILWKLSSWITLPRSILRVIFKCVKN